MLFSFDEGFLSFGKINIEVFMFNYVVVSNFVWLIRVYFNCKYEVVF